MLMPPTIGNAQVDNGEYPHVRARMDAFYTESYTINAAQWSEADLDTRCEAGDTAVFSDMYGNVPLSRRQLFGLNRVRPVVNMIGGFQRRNRKSMIATPVENGDEETANQYSKILMWVAEQEGILETLSDSFHGALVTGLDLMEVYLDYRTDPIAGNIKVDRIPNTAFIIDPYFRKHDLSDCNGIWSRRYLTKQEILSLLPDREDEISNMSGYAMGGNKDGKFQYMPETYNYGPKNYLTYDSFYYKDYRQQKMLVDTTTGEATEWKGKDKDELRQFMQAYPDITELDQEIPTVRLAIAVNNKVLFDGPNPLGIDRYPYVATLGYYNPEIAGFPERVQGVVRGLRDAQYLYNRRKNIELDIMESQVNSGFIYKENALVNPQDIFMQGQGKGIALKEEATMTDVQPIQAPVIPPTMLELSKILSEEINKISGVNEELMGSAVDEKAGILSMLRQGAGLTTLQKLFDQLDFTQKQLGRVVMDVVQANFTPGKVARIIEEEPAPQFYNKAFGTYDVVVEEGLNTSTQRQMQFAQLLQLREAGVQVPDHVLLDAATVQNKKELVDAIKQQEEQQAQQQQQQQQVAMQEMSARAELSHARSQADLGQAAERFSRVEENEALAIERMAEANKDDEAALLNKVKAIMELNSLDLDNLQKLVTIANSLKAAEREQTEAVPASRTSTLAQMPNTNETGIQPGQGGPAPQTPQLGENDGLQ